MKTLYLDIFSGISGDMLLGALIDLGVDPVQLERELAKLDLAGYRLHTERKTKSGIAGVWFNVRLESETARSRRKRAQPHCESRDFSQIRELINRSSLSDWVREESVAVFRRIAQAEGKIHGLPPERVHFHEVGAVDSIVDVVGACVALQMLGKPRMLASPVADGTGWIKCAHGVLPVPAPATLEILGARGIPLTQCDEPHELVTPTGAALLAEFVESFGPMTGLVAEKIGYGLGTRESKTRPNVLRAVLGKQQEGRSKKQGTHDWETGTVAVLETNLDDINAEILGNFMEKALEAGALDVFHTPIQMKKSRPGVLLTVLCAEADADKFTEMMLRQTSAFGVRRCTAERRKLQREFVTVKTAHGDVKVKLGKLDGKVLHAAPEFESCRELAEQTDVPVKQVYEEAVAAVWNRRIPKSRVRR